MKRSLKSTVNFLVHSYLMASSFLQSAFIAAAVLNGQFRVNNINNRTMTPIQAGFTSSSLLSCAARCVTLTPNCRSFTFDKQSRTCVLGSWLTPAEVSNNYADNIIYYSGDYCNTATQFSVYNAGGRDVCLWANTDLLTAEGAKQKCEGLGGHLYTPKTTAEMDLIQNLYGLELLWIGLSDKGTNGVYVWDDDNTVIDESFKNDTFSDPMNPDPIKECIFYQDGKLEQGGCDDPIHSLCEIDPGN